MFLLAHRGYISNYGYQGRVGVGDESDLFLEDLMSKSIREIDGFKLPHDRLYFGL
jgi:hypothetical protein